VFWNLWVHHIVVVVARLDHRDAYDVLGAVAAD